MNHRLERVNELLKREIGEAIRRELPIAEAGLITVNDVNVSGDLQAATVFVSIFGDDLKKKRGTELLQEYRRLIQYRVGQSIVLKYTPQLRFVVDDSIARGDRVLAIIEELEKTDAKPSGK